MRHLIRYLLSLQYVTPVHSPPQPRTPSSPTSALPCPASQPSSHPQSRPSITPLNLNALSISNLYSHYHSTALPQYTIPHPPARSSISYLPLPLILISMTITRGQSYQTRITKMNTIPKYLIVVSSHPALSIVIFS